MSRRRKLFLLALVLGSTAIYAVWRAPEWGARLVEHLLGRYFRRPVQVESITVRPGTLEFEVHGLRVGGITPDAPPFLEVPSARVRPSFAPLRGNRLVLSRVRVEGLRLRINAFPSPPLGPGGDDIPKMGGGGRGGGLQVAIQRLVIVGGEFLLNHERVPLDVDLPDFHGRLSGRPEGGLAGHISFEPGRLKMGEAPDLPVGTEIDVVVHRGVVEVEGARLVAEKTNLAYRGRIRLAGRPQGQLSLEGPVDLAVLERHVFRSGLRFEGAARWNGLLSIDGSRLRIEGRMEGTGGAFMGVAVPRFAGWLSYDGTQGLVLRDLDVDALGGSGRLAVDVPPTATHRPVHIRGPVREADGEGILRMIFGWGEMRLGTAATGEVDVSWPKGKTRLVSGTIGVDLAERADGRFPLSGRLDWRAEDGRQTYERALLRGPGMQGSVSGEVDAEDRARLEVDGETEDLAATETVLTRVRRALGNPEAQPAGFSGGGRFRGSWRGTLDWPVFAGPLRGRGRRLRRGGLGARGVDGHPGHGRRVRRVAPARAAEGRGGDPLGGPHGDRLVRPPGRARRSRPRLLVAGRGPRHVHGVGRQSHRPADRRGGGPRPAERAGRRGEGPCAWRPVLHDPLRRGAHRVALEGARRQGHPRRGAHRGRHRRLPRQRDRRRRLRRLRRDGGGRSRRPRAAAFPGRGLRRPALRPPRDAGHPHAAPAPREPLLAPALPRRRGHRRPRGAARRHGGRPGHRRWPLPLRARRPGPRGDGGRPPALRGGPHPLRALDQPRPLPARGRAGPPRRARAGGLRRRAPARPPGDAGRDPGGGGGPRPPAAPPRLPRPVARARAAHLLRRPARSRRLPPGGRRDRPRRHRRGGRARRRAARRVRPRPGGPARPLPPDAPPPRLGRGQPRGRGLRHPVWPPASWAPSTSRGPGCACAASPTESRASGAACASPSARPSSRG